MDSVTNPVIVNPGPIALFTSDTVCEGIATTFTDLSTTVPPLGGPIDTYLWEFGDPSTGTSPLPNPTYIYAQAGIYIVNLTVTDVNGCQGYYSDTVVVDTIPISNFTATEVCHTFPTIFTDQSLNTSGTIVSWSWDFGDGIGTSNLQNDIYTYPNPGSYTVTLTVTDDNGCSDTWDSTITVRPNPTAIFTADTVCVGFNTTFTDLSTIVPPLGGTITDWDWDFGDGPPPGTSILQHPSYGYIDFGTFNVKLIITDQYGCMDSVTNPVIVNPGPIALFTSDTVCEGIATTFTDLSTTVPPLGGPIDTYLWEFGDPSTGTSPLPNPTYIYAQAGIYIVNLTVTDVNGCQGYYSDTVVVDTIPISNFTATEVCHTFPTIFTDQSLNTSGTIVSWSWDFGDGIGTSNLQNDIYTYPNPGSYTVTLTVTDDNGCSDTWDSTITVRPNPTAIFTADTVCVGFNTTFTDLSTIVPPLGGTITDWDWDFGDGPPPGTSILQHPSYGYIDFGTFNVKLIITDQYGCMDSVTNPVIVNPGPIALFTSDTVCEGIATTFTDLSTTVPPLGGPIDTYLWEFGDPSTGTSPLPNPTYIYAQAGIYIVNLTVTDVNGCQGYYSDTVVVDTIPISNFTATEVCHTFPTIFTDQSLNTSGTIVSWSWDFGDGIGTSNLQNDIYTYPNPGSYTVTLTVTDDNGCSDTWDSTITVRPNPTAIFTADTVCVGFNTTFTDLSTIVPPLGGTITDWDWDFGDGPPPGTSILQHPSYGYIDFGTFNVKLIITDQYGCMDSVTNPVIVNPGPIALFTSDTVCEGIATTFTDLSTTVPPLGGPIDTYLWEFGDPSTGTSPLPNPTYIYAQAGIYIVNLTVTDVNGCQGYYSDTVVVDTIPISNFTATEVCHTFPTIFTDQSLNTSGTIVSWSWDFGDGIGTSNLQNDIYTYPNPGSYTVTLTVTDDNGCSDTWDSTITVRPNPTAIFTADTVCVGFNTTFTDLSTIVPPLGGTITDWDWDFGDGPPPGTSILQHPSYGYIDFGTFNVKLIITDQYGCMDSVTNPVIVNPGPIALFTSDTVCEGIATTFTDLSTTVPPLGGPIDTYLWEFGDPSTGTSPLPNPTYIYAQAGIYIVNLTVTDVNGCQGYYSDTVVVDTIPISNFTATEVCHTFPTIFTDQSLNTSGTIVSWSWDFGDGIGTSNLQNDIYTYPNPGSYTVTLTVTDDNDCSDTWDSTITVRPNPTAIFTADTVCVGFNTTFTDLSTIVPPLGGTITDWDWDFGDGPPPGTSILQHPSYGYIDFGTFNVKLIITDQYGCMDSVTNPVIVNPGPIALFTSDTVCEGIATTFTDLSTTVPPLGGPIDTYLWEFGDPSTGTSPLPNPTYIYAQAGIYIVNLTVTDVNGCQGYYSDTVVVDTIPISNFTATEVCHTFPTIFTDQSLNTSGTIVSWSWDFGDGIGTSNLQNDIYTYPNPGSYTVTLTVTDDNGCSDTWDSTITVRPNPTAIFTADTVCVGFNTTFTDLSTIVPPLGGTITDWDWDFGDGPPPGTSILQHPSYGYIDFGTFNVKLIITDQYGCMDSVTNPVIVNPGPIALFTSDTVCEGIATTFTDLSTTVPPLGGPIDTYLWEFGDPSTGTSPLPNPTYIYAQAGIYIVNLTVTDVNGCQGYYSDTVVVDTIPISNFTATEVCHTFPTIFTDQSLNTSGTIVSWSWDFGDGIGTSNLQNDIYTYPNPGSYTVTLTVTDDNGCSDTWDSTITVRPNPTAIFTADTVCVGFNTTFTDLSTIVPPLGGTITDWDWDFGDGPPPGTSILQHPSYGYIDFGTFNVKLIITDQYGCMDSVTNPVIVNPGPIALFTSDTVCEGIATTFTDLSTTVPPLGGPIDTYLWEFGDPSTGTSPLPNPTYIYAQAGIYIVNLTVTDVNGCQGYYSDTVVVDTIPISNFTATEVCHTFPTIFTDQSLNTSGTIVSWSWDFGDGIGTSNLQNDIYTYPNPGSYTVTLTVTDDNGCSDTWDSTITVRPNPTAIFTADTVCVGFNTTFTDLSTIVPPLGGTITDWDWDFGDGPPPGTSILQHPSYGYIDFGTFNVKLIITDQYGCMDSVTNPVIVNPGPIALFTSDTVCEGIATTFTDLSTTVPPLGGPIDTYLWEFGDPSTGTSPLPNPTYIYAQAGIYIVNLTVTDVNGCQGYYSDTVVVDTIPISNFTATEVCHTFPTIFTDQSLNTSGTIVSWSWDFGDGIGTSNLQNDIYTYPNPGSYTVTLTVTDDNDCSDTWDSTITVRPNPTAIFTADTVCVGFNTTFTDLSTIVPPLGGTITDWDWDFGDGPPPGTSILQHPSYGYIDFGTFNVKLIITDQYGCMDSVTNPVIVNPGPIALFTSDTVCEGIATTFTDLSTTVPPLGGPIDTYLWEFGDPSTGTSPLPNPTYIYAQAGIYIVNLTVTDVNGCQGYYSDTVVVDTIPISNFTATEVCHTFPTIFTDQSLNTSGTIVSWSWISEMV